MNKLSATFLIKVPARLYMGYVVHKIMIFLKEHKHITTEVLKQIKGTTRISETVNFYAFGSTKK